MSATKTCGECGRILFPTREGKLPAHREPANTTGRVQNSGGFPFTGRDEPWCVGGMLQTAVNLRKQFGRHKDDTADPNRP